MQTTAPTITLAQVQERLDAGAHVRCAVLVIPPLGLVFFHLVEAERPR